MFSLYLTISYNRQYIKIMQDFQTAGYMNYMYKPPNFMPSNDGFWERLPQKKACTFNVYTCLEIFPMPLVNNVIVVHVN